jgi:MFS family permease
LACLPLYLQIVKGQSATAAGLLMLPFMLGIMTASTVSGRLIAKTGRYRVFPIVGMVAMSASLVLFSTIGVDTPLWPTLAFALLMGLGLGLCMQTLLLAVQNGVPPTEVGVASGSATFFRQMGGTVGTAVFLSILFGVVGDRIAGAFRNAAGSTAFTSAMRDPQVLANPANRAVLDAVQHGPAGGGGLNLNDTSFLSHIDPRLARPFLEGFSSSMDTVFLVGAVVLAVGFVLVWFLKEVPLSMQSGMQRRAADAAEEQLVPAPVVGE